MRKVHDVAASTLFHQSRCHSHDKFPYRIMARMRLIRLFNVFFCFMTKPLIDWRACFCFVCPLIYLSVCLDVWYYLNY